jgi:hypothetical protein
MLSLLQDMSRHKQATILMIDINVRFRSRKAGKNGIQQRQVLAIRQQHPVAEASYTSSLRPHTPVA